MTEYIDAYQISELFGKHSHSFVGYLQDRFPAFPAHMKRGYSSRSEKKVTVRLWDKAQVLAFKALYENKATRDSMEKNIRPRNQSSDEMTVLPRFANDLATLFIRRAL